MASENETLNSPLKSSASALGSSKLLLLSPAQSSSPTPPHFNQSDRLQSMFCSVPTTVKSSKWLHRLRSSRGFPDSDHIDLEHFLSSSLEIIDPQMCTDSALTDKRPQLDENFVAERCDDNGGVHGRDVINNVLSELFHMGEFEDKSRIKRKKSCRKQHCPRICVVSTNLEVQNVTARKDKFSSPSPLPLTLNSSRKVKEVNQVTERVEEEEEKADRDLSAYSQTEVTVIDTSVPCWKFEKMLYRRKNVWKVGDKKGKGLLMISDRKKKKDCLNEYGGDVQKKKLKKKKLKLCSSSNYVDKEEATVLSKSAQGHDPGKMMVVAFEKKHDNCNQVQEKSFCKKQIDEGSSVILIKSIPTTKKKNVSGVSNSCAKSMQR